MKVKSRSVSILLDVTKLVIALRIILSLMTSVSVRITWVVSALIILQIVLIGVPVVLLPRLTVVSHRTSLHADTTGTRTTAQLVGLSTLPKVGVGKNMSLELN